MHFFLSTLALAWFPVSEIAIVSWNSMECHGRYIISMAFQWNSVAFRWNAMGFHGMPWTLYYFHGISVEFYGIQVECHGRYIMGYRRLVL